MTIRVRFNPEKIFHPKQLVVYDNMSQTGVNVLAAGRRFGKSFLASYWLIIKLMSKRNVVGFWVSPSFTMSRNAWRRIKAISIRTTQGTCDVNETLKRIIFPNGSELYMHSATDPQSLRSEGLYALVIDEAASIDSSAWYEALLPSLSDYPDSSALIIGTPMGLNWFYEVFQQGKLGENGYKSFQYTSYDNPHISHAKIDLDKLLLGDRRFRQEHLAEFLTDSGVIFVREHFRNRMDAAAFKPVSRFISWDTASTTNAASAYSCAVVGELDAQYRLFIREVYRAKIDYVKLEQEVTRLAQKYNADGLLEGIIIEYAASGIQLFSSLVATLPEDLSDLLVRNVPVGKKPDRAREASVFMEKDRVYFPLYDEYTEWLVPFQEELLKASDPVPKDSYYDQVDAFSQLCKVLYAPLAEGILFSKN